MTLTQVPVLGPEKRSLTRTEGLRLQGFPDEHQLPAFRSRAFAALGNAVHVGVVREIAMRVLGNRIVVSSVGARTSPRVAGGKLEPALQSMRTRARGGDP